MIQWTLRKKLLFGFLIVSLGLGATAVIGFTSLQSVVTEYKKITDISLVNIGHISGMRARSRQTYTDMLKLILFNQNPKLSEEALAGFNKASTRYEEIVADYLKVGFIQGEGDIYKLVDNGWKNIKGDLDDIMHLYKENPNDNLEKMKAIIETRLDEKFQKHQSDLLALDDFQVETGEKWSARANEIAIRTKNLLVVISLTIFCLAVAIALFLSESITRKINTLARRLSQSSDQVTVTSKSVSTASTELSESSQKQAAALQETVTATNEVTAMIQKTSENANNTLLKAQSAQLASDKGREAVKNVVLAIEDMAHATQEMSEQVQSSNNEMTEIVKLIEDIRIKTKVINDIVFQTKLLSFNASVEAARAGEMGKGFSVVAEEVGNLAEMSGQASKDISTLLEESAQKVQFIVSKTQSSVSELVHKSESKVNNAKQVADSCDVALNEIGTYVQSMNGLVVEITVASKEQAVGIAEIGNAMGQIDLVTNQNAASAQLCSTASEELAHQAVNARDVVQELLAVVHGNRTIHLSETQDSEQHEDHKSIKHAA